MFGFFRKKKNGLESRARFEGENCRFSIRGFLGSDSHLDRVEANLNLIEANKNWKSIRINLSRVELGPGSLPTYLFAIIIKLAGLANERGADWQLILADEKQLSMIHFLRWPGGKDFINDHIIFASSNETSPAA